MKNAINQPKVAREAFFSIDNTKAFRGYTLGEIWNGYARPYFTKETAEEICKSTSITENNEYLNFYDEKTDSFYCEGYHNDYKREVIASPKTITLEDGNSIKTYSFGDAGWCWDEVEDNLLNTLITKAEESIQKAISYANSVESSSDKTAILNAQYSLAQFHAYMDLLDTVCISHFTELTEKTSAMGHEVLQSINKIYQ